MLASCQFHVIFQLLLLDIPCRTLPLLLFIGKGVSLSLHILRDLNYPPPPRGSEYADLMSAPPPQPPQTGTGDRVRHHSSSPIVNKQDVLPHNSVPDDGSFQSQ